jgi:hypothetical protein
MLKKKYPIEEALETTVRKIGKSIERWTFYLTHPPKRKEIRMVFIIEIILLFITLDLSLLALIMLLRG